MGKNFTIPMSRRDFFKLAGLTTAGLMLNNPAKKVEAAEHFNFDGTNIPTLMTADVCVCGGGPSGTAAAVTAAKNGLNVVLVEKGIVLGGMATLGCVYPCMPTFAFDSDTPHIREVNSRIKAHGVEPVLEIEVYTFYGGGAGQYQPEILAEVYDEMCEEYGVNILYNTVLVGVQTDGGKITSCIVHTIEGLKKISANIFIDATGDAVLSRLAGVPIEKGSGKTGKNQPMSFRFEMGGINENKAYKFFTKKLKDNWSQDKPPHFEFAKYKKNEDFFNAGVTRGEVTKEDMVYIQAFTIDGKPDTMTMNCPQIPGEFSSTDAISYSKAVTYGRKMIRRLAKFFIKNIPGFEKAYISREASVLGVRESWRIRGKYYLTEADYFEAHKFPDAICKTAYQIDIHDTNLELSEKLKRGEYYEIPYRALITNEFENLIVVGRCISSDFSAQSSIRIQPTCMSMGEAAGIASAWSLKNNIAVNQIDWATIPENKRSYVSGR